MIEDITQLDKLIESLQKIHTSVLKAEEQLHKKFTKIHSNHHYSALNFLRYLQLRSFDMTSIQAHLSALGVSSLSHAERQVLANIENVLYLLNAQNGTEFKGNYPFGHHPVNYMKSAKRLQQNTKRLLGEHIDQIGVMVTLPSYATDIAYLKMLLAGGMTIARINTSHDDQDTWIKMVGQLNLASKELKKPCSVYVDLSGPKIRTHHLYELKNRLKSKKSLLVRQGDEISLIKEGTVAQFTSAGYYLTCTLPQIIEDVQEGESIWFDDGKIGGKIIQKGTEELVIQITQAAPEGTKLKREKGINLPQTKLNLPSLTEADKSNLDFVVNYADVVGYSFVRTPKDVQDLQQELSRRNAAEMGIVLKIENAEAFQNLPSLILQGLESPSLGIMTARGDLAVELGAERLSEVQEQIMWLCEAALVPNIWATQVLESLAKTGVPSRAEVTDAAMSTRADCVMLNKGPYIDKALSTLTNILDRMEHHVYKKQSTLRMLQVAKSFTQQWGEN